MVLSYIQYKCVTHTHTLTHTLFPCFMLFLHYCINSIPSVLIHITHTHTFTDDCVIITEQTLDQQSFIIINKRTGERGRVPVDYIRIGKISRARIGYHVFHAHSLYLEYQCRFGN